MAVNGKRTAIARDDVDVVGDRFAVPDAARIVEQVLAAVDEWPRYADEAGVPRAVSETVHADISIWSKPLH
jgi:serine/threonine-protein kinase HipA